ncbi:MAG: type II secretion system protein GspM [Gammaproteobacteria bacterium]
MTSNLTPSQSRLLALGLLVLVLGGLYFGVVHPLWRTYYANQEQIEDHRENIARFQRIAAEQHVLEQRVEGLSQQRKLVRYTLDAESPTLAAAALQDRVKSIVEQSGGRLTSTRILPVSNVGPFAQVAVNVQMRVSTKALQDVLYGLESGAPYLLIENLTILSRGHQVYRRGLSTAAELDVRFDLSGLMPSSET